MPAKCQATLYYFFELSPEAKERAIEDVLRENASFLAQIATWRAEDAASEVAKRYGVRIEKLEFDVNRNEVSFDGYWSARDVGDDAPKVAKDLVEAIKECDGECMVSDTDVLLIHQGGVIDEPFYNGDDCEPAIDEINQYAMWLADELIEELRGAIKRAIDSVYSEEFLEEYANDNFLFTERGSIFPVAQCDRLEEGDDGEGELG